MSAILEFKKVTKNFGSIKALDEVDFSIDKGEFVFIVGPSGAGKTTLLKLLIGEFSPTEGEILFEDQDVGKYKKKNLHKLRRKIGVVFQDYKLLANQTVYENVEIALAIKGVKKDEWEARILKVLELVGLSERGDLFPSQLSGGELQRVALARALVVNPDLIFADEPTGNLDWETAESVIELLSKINDEGKTVIVTTHNKEILDKLKKRTIELKKGKVVSDSYRKK